MPNPAQLAQFLCLSGKALTLIYIITYTDIDSKQISNFLVSDSSLQIHETTNRPILNSTKHFFYLKSLQPISYSQTELKVRFPLMISYAESPQKICSSEMSTIFQHNLVRIKNMSTKSITMGLEDLVALQYDGFS